MLKRSIILPLLLAMAGAGLGLWSLATPAHGAPAALQPLQITKIASDGDQFPPSHNAYYEISIHNPNGVTVFLDSLTDTLPPGFSYNADSASGLTSDNPAESGQTLTWTFVSEESVGAGLTETEFFTVFISADEPVGMYCNNASVDWFNGNLTGSASTGPTAPIQVLNEGDTQLTPTCGGRRIVRTATPTVTVTAPATATEVPATSTPVPPTATATQPAGGSAGVISAPNTGSGPDAGGPSMLLLAIAAAMVAGGVGAAAVGARRR